LGEVKKLLEEGAGCWAVRGVKGVAGVGGILGLPLTRESHFLVEGPIAIFARESFMDMERRRLCGEDLRIGEAAFVVDVS
jgi:hypothetical protein